MANTSFTGPVRSQNGFQGYSNDSSNVSLTLSAQGTGVVLNTSSVPFFQLTATTASPSDNSTKVATTAYVDTAIGGSTKLSRPLQKNFTKEALVRVKLDF